MELKMCGQPWFEMQIEYSEKVGCCCYYKFGKDSLNTPLDVDRYWNGNKIKEIRKTISSNNAEGTGCDGCQYIKYSSVSNFVSMPDNLNPIQSDNWSRALNNYHDKRITVDSYPVKYYMNFGLACNLKCIMCCQAESRKVDKRQLPVEPLLELKPFFIKANEIAIIGGEPLMIPDARKFIDAIIHDPDYSDVKLSIFTNGTLLHKYIEPFRNMKRIGICISLDSIGNAYEYIRQGAKWEDTENNIIEFKETGKQLGHSWDVNIAAIVMKSSIPLMDDFVEWCIAHDTPVHFVPLNEENFTGDEDVFRNPVLLNNIPAWEDILDSAINKLEKRGWTAGGANSLKLIKKELVSRLLNYKGEELFNSGDIEGSFTLFAKSVESDPAFVTAFNNMGVVCWQSGDRKGAIKHFLKALKNNPYNRDTVMNCGRILVNIDQHEDARKLYKSYLTLHPDDNEIRGLYTEIEEIECVT